MIDDMGKIFRQGSRGAQVPRHSVEEAVALERGRACGAAHQATLARTRYHLLEERAIKHGRSAGVSWDELGRWLLCSGESLRRRYASMVE